MDWRASFSNTILSRGLNYALKGKVKGLTANGDRVMARVLGTKVYLVQITGIRSGELRMSCSCPYAAHGENCKHMAAVFYMLGKRFPDIVTDDDAALTARLNTLSPDETEDALQFAIECGSTRCVVILLNRRSADGQLKFSPDEFTLDDIPEDMLPGAKADAQGDNDPMKLLFPEEFAP